MSRFGSRVNVYLLISHRKPGRSPGTPTQMQLERGFSPKTFCVRTFESSELTSLMFGTVDQPGCGCLYIEELSDLVRRTHAQLRIRTLTNNESELIRLISLSNDRVFV